MRNRSRAWQTGRRPDRPSRSRRCRTAARRVRPRHPARAVGTFHADGVWRDSGAPRHRRGATQSPPCDRDRGRWASRRRSRTGRGPVDRHPAPHRTLDGFSGGDQGSIGGTRRFNTQTAHDGRWRSTGPNPGGRLVDGQPLAPFGSAPFEYDTAVLGAHAHEEAVGTAAATTIGLERTLHSTRDSRRSLHRIGAGKEVSTRALSGGTACGRFASLPRTGRKPGSFPHLWKNLWKSEGF
jgi:hypothetical protein